VRLGESVMRVMFAAAVLSLVSMATAAQTPLQRAMKAAKGAVTKDSAPAVALTPYTTTDQSASAGVPAGWNVTLGANGVIQIAGPQGESISMGNTLFVRDGQFQIGEQYQGDVAMAMPYQAKLEEKYSMLWQEAASIASQPDPQISFVSDTPVPLAKTIAECEVLLGSETGATGPEKFEAQFCSLPMDSSGVFKLFWKNATVPASLAPTERTTAEAVLASYKVDPATLKTILAPSTPPVPPAAAGGAAGGAAGESSAAYADRMATQSATCVDDAMQHESKSQLPSYCH
jgi:hypothetical protein